MKSPGWLSPHCPEDGRELPNVSANALLQYRPQGFMENSNYQPIAVATTLTRTKDPGHVVFNNDKDDNDDILTIILRSTSLTDWAGSWMPSRTHGLSCQLRFI